MKNFFTKHRHLIVISLIIAVILVALTPLVVPLGLELEDRIDLPKITLFKQTTRFRKLEAQHMKSYSAFCERHDHRTAEEAIFSGKHSYKGAVEGLEELVAILNDAPEARISLSEQGELLCTLHVFYTDRAQSNLRRREEQFALYGAEGQYSLRRFRANRNEKDAAWSVSEATAQAILAYLPCETQPYYGNPRMQVCDAENIAAAELTTWVGGVQSAPAALTEKQIETLCSFLEAEFLDLIYARSEGVSPAPTENGWRVLFTLADGAVWQMKYSCSVSCSLSLGPVPEGRTTPEKSARYNLARENPFADVPELLGDVP